MTTNLQFIAGKEYNIAKIFKEEHPFKAKAVSQQRLEKPDVALDVLPL